MIKGEKLRGKASVWRGDFVLVGVEGEGF